jgi:drug/metabolite transporter (DMT)-like permease
MHSRGARYSQFWLPRRSASVVVNAAYRKSRVTEAAAPLAAPRTRQDHVVRGIFYMLGATVLFAVSTAIAKWQVAIYPVNEVLFFRAAASLVICALLILPRTGFGVYRTQRFSHHIMRGVAQTYAQTLIMVALSLMPIAGAMAINFSAPLFATLAATLFLHESVGLRRWGALVVGFGGVLLVAAPGADTFQIGAIFAIANAVVFGSVTAAVRGMSATESAETLTMYQMVILTIMFGATLPIGFTVPTANDAIMMTVTGLTNGIGQYWWTRALALGPASAVTPFYYFALVWAMILGYVVWGDIPTPHLLAGSAIVVASGLFLLWQETGRKPRMVE